MKFSLFRSVSAKAEPCTYELFLELTESQQMIDVCNAIADAKDDKVRSQLKRSLPLVTWQASFKERRKNTEAVPSGLFMLDIDHIDSPSELYSKKIAGHIDDWGILMVSKTASRKGLRIVAKCRPEFSTLQECQEWLAKEIGTEYDAVCKDWARASFLTHSSYIYYINSGALFAGEPDCVYSIDAEAPQAAQPLVETDETEMTQAPEVTTYNGIDLRVISREWLLDNGGEPHEGTRNMQLYKLALRMRYLCDFRPSPMLYAIPDYGLSQQEMSTLIKSALSATRGSEMPEDLRHLLKKMEKTKQLGEDSEYIELERAELPTLPPVIRQFANIAPDDFRIPTILCQLPILGALASKLRARYLDGNLHSPSFMVSLEAPQASGKSFARKLVDYELSLMKEHDDQERQREREYNDKVKELKLTNSQVTKKNREEILGSKPETIIRYVPPTMSITMMLMRMHAAHGTHLFALAEEIDTVYKAFKRGFSSFSDALRCSFDNSEYGQDYASETSFSGIVKLYYNCLFCGTPRAMRRFYPDVEDGLVSRVLFVTIPDQFGKPMPIWKEMSEKDKNLVDINLVRLNETTIQGDTIQPEHMLDLDWLLPDIKDWLLKQQQIAVKMEDRTRDIFCRRSAVVGFRAAMLAWYLWNEVNTPPVRKNVKNFAIWVADQMLTQQVLRFNTSETSTNDFPFKKVYDMLPDTEPFDSNKVRTALSQCGYDTQPRMVLYMWRLADRIVLANKIKNQPKSFRKNINDVVNK